MPGRGKLRDRRRQLSSTDIQEDAEDHLVADTADRDADAEDQVAAGVVEGRADRVVAHPPRRREERSCRVDALCRYDVSR